MKRSIIATALLALALTACAPLLGALTGLPAAPAAVADKTIVDEQAALSVELAYQTATQLVLTANRAGLLKDDSLRARVRAADQTAYQGVLAARAAYRAGNAADYGAAAATARAAISDILSAVKGS